MYGRSDNDDYDDEVEDAEINVPIALGAFRDKNDDEV